MSFVAAAPDELLAAAQNLAGIRSILAQSGASAAAPTAGIVAAAEDQVSAQVAAIFGAFGQDYQVISAQAQGFHEQFVNLLGAGAGAYLNTEIANAEQNLLGGARPAAATGLGSLAGPYQTLFAHTTANLQVLGNSVLANPAPFLQQAITNQIGYAQTIVAGAEYIIQNFPAVLANLQANIRAFVQALLAFNPVPYVQQFIANQLAYAQIIATSLQNAARDLGAGLQALPAAFQSAFQALQMGDITGAVADVAQGFLGLTSPSLAITTSGNIAVIPGLTAHVTPAGAFGDLLPILTIPGMVAQNFTDLLPAGSIPALISQNVTNVIDTVTDTSLAAQALLQITVRPPFVNFSLSLTAGLPTALVIEAVGAPYNAAGALGSSVTTFVDQLQTGNPMGAIGTLIDAPAVITDAFLNGESTLPLTFDLSGNPATVNIPFNGILVPPTPYTASVTVSVPLIGPVTSTVPVGGTPISGLATGLLIYAPEQLALAITPTG